MSLGVLASPLIHISVT